ncbi:hypothetical protein L914_18107, partial [Phytophthora nicotianae]
TKSIIRLIHQRQSLRKKFTSTYLAGNTGIIARIIQTVNRTA